MVVLAVGVVVDVHIKFVKVVGFAVDDNYDDACQFQKFKFKHVSQTV